VTVTSREFAETAASLAGSRWRRYGRDPAKGLDCAGIVHAPTGILGLSALPDTRSYDAAMPGSQMLWDFCRRGLIEQPWEDQGEGRVGLCAWDSNREARHIVVMLANREIVHVHAGARRVVRVPASWMDGKLLGVFRVPGVDYGDPW
jgi:hypothetical protein